MLKMRFVLFQWRYLFSHLGEQLGASSEQDYGGGLAYTLAILRQQEVMNPMSAEEQAHDRTQRDHNKWLAEHRARLES